MQDMCAAGGTLAESTQNAGRVPRNAGRLAAMFLARDFDLDLILGMISVPSSDVPRFNSSGPHFVTPGTT